MISWSYKCIVRRMKTWCIDLLMAMVIQKTVIEGKSTWKRQSLSAKTIITCQCTINIIYYDQKGKIMRIFKLRIWLKLKPLSFTKELSVSLDLLNRGYLWQWREKCVFILTSRSEEDSESPKSYVNICGPVNGLH